jgi:predicted transcriptional regulator
MRSNIGKYKEIYSSLVKEGRKHFEPSFRILLRVLEMLLDVGSISKTELSQKAGINYSRLLRHLDWLVERKIAELTVERHKITIRLTQRGKQLASILITSDRR